MGAGLYILTPAASLPVTRAEAKEWCNIHSSVTIDDSLIDALIAVAAADVAAIMSQPIIQCQYRWVLPRWPVTGAFRLPRAPVSGVVQIAYVPENVTNHALTAINAANYAVSTGRGLVVFNQGFSFPTIRVPEAEPIVVDFAAGYVSEATVPAVIKAAVKMMVAHRYTYRGEATDRPLAPVLRSVMDLVSQYARPMGSTLDNLGDLLPLEELY